MKKIRPDKSEQKANRNKFIIGGIIVFLMVGSMLGMIGRDGTGSKVEYYGKLRFELKEDGFYYHKTPTGVMRFNVLPQRIENMTFNSQAIDVLKGKQAIYLTSDINSTFAT